MITIVLLFTVCWAPFHTVHMLFEYCRCLQEAPCVRSLLVFIGLTDDLLFHSRPGAEVRRRDAQHDHRRRPGHRVLQQLQQPHRLRLHERELQEELRVDAVQLHQAAQPAGRRRGGSQADRAVHQTPEQRGVPGIGREQQLEAALGGERPVEFDARRELAGNNGGENLDDSDGAPR